MRKVLSSLIMLCFALLGVAQKPVVIGSQSTIESQIVGQITRKLLANNQIKGVHLAGLKGDGDAWAALRQGKADIAIINIETLGKNIFKISNKDLDGEMLEESVENALKSMGFANTKRLGYNQGWGVAMLRSATNIDEETQLATISQSKLFPQLKIGMAPDQVEPLKLVLKQYSFGSTPIQPINIGEQGKALSRVEANLVLVRRTSPQIDKFDLAILDDDKKVLPNQEGILVYRADLPKATIEALKSLEGTLDNSLMRKMVNAATVSGDIGTGASLFFKDFAARKKEVADEQARIARKTEHSKKVSLLETLSETLGSSAAALSAFAPFAQHLAWMAVPLGLILLIAWPLGVQVMKNPSFGRFITSGLHFLHVMPVIGVLLVLGGTVRFANEGLALLIILTIGGLFPIVFAFLHASRKLSPAVRDAADALGLDPRDRLKRVYIPLVSPAILRASKVTLYYLAAGAIFAGFIGKGGLGQAIFDHDPSGKLKSAVLLILLFVAIWVITKLLERKVPRILRDQEDLY